MVFGDIIPLDLKASSLKIEASLDQLFKLLEGEEKEGVSEKELIGACI